jgi:vitamin B12 transporter
MANLGLRYRAPDGAWHLRANLRRSEGAVDELFGSGRVPLVDYSVLDLAGAYAVDERVELFGRVQNLLDESYQELAGFNAAGVSVFAGIRLRFD